MFLTDPKTLARIARHLDRVLIADPQPAAGKLLSDLIKDMGARHVMVARDQTRAAELARDFDPQLLFIELTGPALDGVAFVHNLRRSDFPSQKSPVVMVTAEATVETIKAARDAGAHEFLRKPFTTGDLFRRVENVMLKPRLWIDAKMYVGPDRRRFNSGEKGPARRRSDTVDAADQMVGPDAVDRALAALRSALAAFAENPQTSLRTMLEQAAELQSVAFHRADPDLTALVASLQRYLLDALERGRISRRMLDEHADAIRVLSGDELPIPAKRAALARDIATRAAAETVAAA